MSQNASAAKPRTRRGSSRADRNIRWIEEYCVVPDGIHIGQPLKLRDWQKEIIRGTYEGDTRRVIASFPRKNGKTALSAILLLLHLVGPEARKNSELYSTALSREQASITFRLASKMVRLSAKLQPFVTIRDTVKQLHCEGQGTLYTALSADASTSMGLSPVFVIHDELGQVRGPRHALYEALETATGAQEAPLSFIISTQAPTDADLLSILIDDAAEGQDERTKLYFYAADQDADPFDEETISAANPAYGDFQNAREIRDMADAARRMPAREAEYRNLILNQRVEASNPVVTKSVWDQNAEEPDLRGPIYAGLDLSSVNDLTALVLIAPRNNRFHVRPIFWLPEEGLEDRARQDRVPYDLWRDQGFLQTTPGRSIEYEYVANYIVQLFNEMDIRRVAFDRWNMRHLRPWLIKGGLNEAFVDERFEDFGQGTKSMHPAMQTIEAALLNGKVCHGNHPVLTMCAMNAVAKSDESGWRKLDKKRSNGRIDGFVALTMAAAMAASELDQQAVYPVDIESILEIA